MRKLDEIPDGHVVELSWDDYSEIEIHVKISKDSYVWIERNASWEDGWSDTQFRQTGDYPGTDEQYMHVVDHGMACQEVKDMGLKILQEEYINVPVRK
jgi:hypothetical protein